MAWSKMVDMEMDDERQLDAPMPYPMPVRAQYPYGLRISLCDDDLKKLGLAADCSVGDVIDMRCFGEVMSVSRNDMGDRVEIQIQKIAVENEMTEDAPGDD